MKLAVKFLGLMMLGASLGAVTPTPTPTATRTVTPTASPTRTASQTRTPTPSAGQLSATRTPTPRAPTPTPTPSVFWTPTAVWTATRLPTPWIYDKSELDRNGTPIVTPKGYWATPGRDLSQMQACR